MRVGLLVAKVLGLDVLTEKEYWVDKVKTKWSPPPGLFTRDPETIASTIADASKDCRQAVARVNFFYNRYGCSGERADSEICSKRDAVLDLVRELKCKR